MIHQNIIIYLLKTLLFESNYDMVTIKIRVKTIFAGQYSLFSMLRLHPHAS